MNKLAKQTLRVGEQTAAGPEMCGSHSTTRLILVFPFVASSFFR